MGFWFWIYFSWLWSSLFWYPDWRQNLTLYEVNFYVLFIVFFRCLDLILCLVYLFFFFLHCFCSSNGQKNFCPFCPKFKRKVYRTFQCHFNNWDTSFLRGSWQLCFFFRVVLAYFFQMFYQYFLPCVVQVKNICSGITAVLKWINLSSGSNPLKLCQVLKIVGFNSLKILN